MAIARFIKNVSSITSHKKNPSLRLSLREFKEILAYTFIDESILIKLYMYNANIMNKYNIHGHWRSQKATFMLISTLNYVLIDNFLSLFIRLIKMLNQEINYTYLLGLSPSLQQFPLGLGGPPSSSLSVLPGRSCPWCRCFLPLLTKNIYLS